MLKYHVLEGGSRQLCGCSKGVQTERQHTARSTLADLIPVSCSMSPQLMQIWSQYLTTQRVGEASTLFNLSVIFCCFVYNSNSCKVYKHTILINNRSRSSKKKKFQSKCTVKIHYCYYRSIKHFETQHFIINYACLFETKFAFDSVC